MDALLHHVRTGGSSDGAPLVVVVHGAMDRSSSFGRVARHLGDVELLRYDRRGYGRSGHLRPASSIAEQADDLLGQLGDQRACIFGHSIGGVIALGAAAAAPHLVTSVLAYEPPAPWAPWWPAPPDEGAGEVEVDPADEAEAFMRRAIGDRYWERLPARTRAERRSEGAALAADLASLRGGAPIAPGKIDTPVLVAYGSETSWWHRRAAQELADQLPGGKLVAVAGAGHGVHLTHPTATADLIVRTLAAGDPSAAR